MSTDIVNIPSSVVVVPVQMQSGGTGSVPGSSPDVRLLVFKRGSPQALGTVQIMVGVVLFMLGVMLCFFADTFTVFSGVFVWAPLFYIIAGSLNVAADRFMSRCLIQASLSMNIVASVFSYIAMVFYGLDSTALHGEIPLYSSLLRGVSWVQLALNLLVFIISIFGYAFGCKAICCQAPTLQFVVMGNQLSEGSTVMSHALPTYEAGLTLPDGGTSSES